MFSCVGRADSPSREFYRPAVLSIISELIVNRSRPESLTLRGEGGDVVKLIVGLQ
jgi:hypothetical protein